MARDKEHNWPVSVLGLDGLRLGSLVWLYRSHHYVTVVAKMTHRLSEDGLGRSVPKDARPYELVGRPHEVFPALSRTDIFVRSSREGQLHLGVYRGQQPLLQKSGSAKQLAPLPATDTSRTKALDTINGGGLWRLPEDFAWEALQAAPSDQQLPFLTGGEWVVVGVSGDAQATRFQLPTQAPEFVVRGADAEVAAPTLDTVHIDLDAREVTLLWRTRIPIDSPLALTSMTVIARVEREGALPEDLSAAQKKVKVPPESWAPKRKLKGDISPQQLTTTMSVSGEAGGQVLPFQASGVAIRGAEGDIGPASETLDPISISYQDAEPSVDLGKTMDGHDGPPKRAPLPFEGAGLKPPPPPRKKQTGGLPFGGAKASTGTSPPRTAAPALPFGESAPVRPPPPSRPGSPAPPPVAPPPMAPPPSPAPPPVAPPPPVAAPPMMETAPASTTLTENLAETTARDEPEAPTLTDDAVLSDQAGQAQDEPADASRADGEDDDEIETIAPPPPQQNEAERYVKPNLLEELRLAQKRLQTEAETREDTARRERAAAQQTARARANRIVDALYRFRIK